MTGNPTLRFDTDLINSKMGIEEVVRMAGGNPKFSGGRYSCACPLHGGDNPTAFSIYQKDGKWFWNCFTGSCGGGDLIKFVELWQNITFYEACEWINGGKIQDLQGLKESAERRLAQATQEKKEADERYKARLHEFQHAQRHLAYQETLKSRKWMRDLWESWGIDEGMQDFWYLGGCDDFLIDGDYHTPTLTIPILGEEYELLNIQHRLIKPKVENSKYRYDRTGLNAHPFLSVPPMGYDGDYVLVMEGAKKAMVTWTQSDCNWQTIGLASQSLFPSLIEKLRPVGKRVVVIPDPNTARNPNAWKKAYELAKGVGGFFMPVPLKIDDYIMSAGLNKNDLFGMIKQSRKA